MTETNLFHSDLDGDTFRNGRTFVPIWTEHDPIPGGIMANRTAAEKYVPRHSEARVREALADTRIVAIVGPRQSGKTTLARRIAADDGRPFISLDDDQHRRFAGDDPLGLVRGNPTAVIDEIQRAPALILAIKQAVDEDPRPGRYLITGSVDLFRAAISPDSLAGRIETIELLPFSQAEIARTGAPGFLDRAFAGDFPSLAEAGATTDLTQRILAGGYPEALSRPLPSRRASWLRSYARSLAERDVSDIANVGNPAAMARLLDHAAASSGQLLNMSGIGARLGVDGKTVDRWLALFEHMFLVRRVYAWHRNDLKRLVKRPKLQFLDSGLLAALRRIDPAAIAGDRQKLGPLLECFVYSEIARAAALSDHPILFSHYRDKDRVEVDLVLERLPGAIVGIEVKAGATAHPGDFKGLARLREATGRRFACGIVLHDGDRIQQVGPKLFAMPVGALWNGRR